MVAPDVIGYNHAKKNLLLCAASTGADPRKRKVNVGFIEDSGFAKSTLPMDVMQEHFTINKRGISSTIASPTPIIAFVNPIDGHWRDTAAAPLRHDICCFITWGFIIKNRTIFHKE